MPPPLRALLPTLARQLRRHQRPAVAVLLLLGTEGERRGRGGGGGRERAEVRQGGGRPSLLTQTFAAPSSLRIAKNQQREAANPPGQMGGPPTYLQASQLGVLLHAPHRGILRIHHRETPRDCNRAQGSRSALARPPAERPGRLNEGTPLQPSQIQKGWRRKKRQLFSSALDSPPPRLERETGAHAPGRVHGGPGD